MFTLSAHSESIWVAHPELTLSVHSEFIRVAHFELTLSAHSEFIWVAHFELTLSAHSELTRNEDIHNTCIMRAHDACPLHVSMCVFVGNP
jgi:hypothetical protein